MQYTNKYGLPAAFVSAASSGRRDFDMSTYSVTELLKGPREILLSRRHDAELSEDVSECVWRILGTAVHKVFEEQPREPGELREVRLRASSGSATVTGKFDSFNELSGELLDWKTSGARKVAKGEFDDWRTQALAYAWLLFENGYEPRSARFVVILKDFSPSQAGSREGYPEAPVAVVDFPVSRELAYEVGAVLQEKADRLASMAAVPDWELPLCSEHERWALPKTYCVMRDGASRATKNFGTDRDAAEDFADSKGAGYSVVERGGGDNKCARYCAAAPFCSHWVENYGPDAG